MNDFFRKLNVLVKASLNDLLDTEGEPRRRTSAGVSGRDMERDVQMLRQRVDEALRYEDDLAARVQALQAEVERLDREADEALNRGQELEARQLVQQLQRSQQRLAMLEADLREHRLVTQELIVRVSELESVVTEAQRSQPPAADSAEDALERAGQKMADVLQEMRERITEMSQMVGPANAEAPAEEAPPPDDEQVDDDLARRRNRLSKK